MAICDQSGDRLLDFLYGLLDEEESAALRGHLETCAGCQAALKKAEQDRRLFAQAAQVSAKVAPFVAPDFDREPASPAAAIAAGPPPGTPVGVPALAGSLGEEDRLKPGLQRHKVPRPRWMIYTLVGMAASVLIALVLAESYRNGLNDRETQLAQAKSNVEKVDKEFASAQSQFEEQTRTVKTNLDKETLQVRVSGPTELQPQAAASYQVITHGTDGARRAAKLGASVVDKADQRQVFKKEVASTGLAKIDLPAGLNVKQPELIVRAKVGAQKAAEVKTDLQNAPPAFLTHVTTNKASYQVGELLLFRTVTLDRASLKPPSQPVVLHYSLVDGDGNVVKELRAGTTGAGGIAGGEFALTQDIPSGLYYLEVASVGRQGPVQRRRVEIVHESTPIARVDGDRYQAGEKANISVLNRKGQAPLSNQAITIQEVSPNGNSLPGKAIEQTTTNIQGQAAYQLPKTLSSASVPLKIQVLDGNRNDTVWQSVPVVPSKLSIEFFPEGGTLVEGLPTRVYYRVASLQGDPVAFAGRVVVESSSGKIFESLLGQEAGVFMLTPSRKEKYTVRIAGSPVQLASSNFEKLGIRTDGVGLSIPAAVSREGEPIRVILRSKGELKRLLVLVTCRGQVVEQALLDEGQEDLTLNPPAGAEGMMSVAVYQIKGDAPVPLAERLIFRTPAKRLELSALAAVNGQPCAGVVAPGSPVQMTIKGTDEKGQPIACWSCAAVVESRASKGELKNAGGETETDLPSQFLLTGDAQLMLRDDPAGRQALDLYLGTQSPRTALSGHSPIFFSVENASLAKLQQQYDAQLSKNLSDLRGAFARQREEMLQQREQHVKDYNALSIDIAEFREWPTQLLRQALAIFVVLGLAAGAVMLLFGFGRLLRRRSATFALAGSFALLCCVCLVMFLALPSKKTDDEPIFVAKLPAASWPADRPTHMAKSPRSSDLTPAPGTFIVAGRPTAEGGIDLAKRNADEVSPLKELRASETNAEKLGKDKLAAPKEDRVQAEAKKGVAHSADAVKDMKHEEKPGKDAFGANGTKQLADAEQKERFRQAKQAQEEMEQLKKQAEPGPLGGGAAGKAPSAAPGGPGSAMPPPPAKMTPAAPVPAPAAPIAPAIATNNAKLEKAKEQQTARGGFGKATQQLAIANRHIGPPADTILWQPTLFAPNGSVQVDFTMPNQPGVYRVIVHGHTADGRLGFYEGTLQVLPSAR